jgi:DNA-binding transcriptional LysR family regulator
VLNLRGVDLNLLTVFEAVYEDCNQARASERLAMTQPAVSNAMARLRQVVGDELFVPGPRGVTPTPVADQFYAQIHPALELVREGIEGGRTFDPLTSNRTFRVAVSYAGGAMGAGLFLRWARREAPGVTISVRPIYRPAELPRHLREGRLDVAFDYSPWAEEDLIAEPFRSEGLVVIVRNEHPRIHGRLTLKQFLAEEHAVHYEPRQSGGAPELYASLAGLSHRVAMEVASALALPIVVSQTDLLAVVTERLAAFFEKPLKLQVLPTPFKAPPIPSYLIWHRSRARDPGHRWLRESLRTVFFEPEGTSARAGA